MSSYETEEMRLDREEAERIRLEKEKRLEEMRREAELVATLVKEFDDFKFGSVAESYESIMIYDSLQFITEDEGKAIYAFRNGLNTLEDMDPYLNGASSNDILNTINDAKTKLVELRNDFSPFKHNLDRKLNVEKRNLIISAETSRELSERQEISKIEFKKNFDVKSLSSAKTPKANVEASKKFNLLLAKEKFFKKYTEYLAVYGLYSAETGENTSPAPPDCFKDIDSLQLQIEEIDKKLIVVMNRKKIETAVTQTLDEMGITVHKEVLLEDSNLMHLFHSNYDESMNIHTSISDTGFVMIEPIVRTEGIIDNSSVVIFEQENSADTEYITIQKEFCEFHKEFIRRLKTKGVEIGCQKSHDIGERVRAIVSKSNAKAKTAVKNGEKTNTIAKIRR